MDKKIDAAVKKAKLIQDQVEYALKLDATSMRKSLISISILAGEIIDEGEGY